MAVDTDDYKRQEDIDKRNWANMNFDQRMQCLDGREEHAEELSGNVFE